MTKLFIIFMFMVYRCYSIWKVLMNVYAVRPITIYIHIYYMYGKITPHAYTTIK